jgi:casein kinase II subunit alpha
LGVISSLPSQLEQYTISHKIGRGRYSHVFEGKNAKNKEKVAIKVLLPISPLKIKREYHILKALNHPNIIKIVDVVKCAHLKTASVITEHL